MTIYVGMTDTFMSDWGASKGRTSRYVIACDTTAQAQQIERAAHKRGEMKRITTTTTEPKSNRQRLVTLREFHDLGELWTGELACI